MKSGNLPTPAERIRRDMGNEDLLRDLRKLADGWCKRQAFGALRRFLPGYFVLNGLTDGLGHLEDALASTHSELTKDEREEVCRPRA